MANNTISQVEINGTTYDLLDANTLSAVSALDQRVTSLESSVDRIHYANLANKLLFNFWNNSSNQPDSAQIQILDNTTNSGFILTYGTNSISLRKRVNSTESTI